MAVTTFLIAVSFFAITSAGFPWADDDDAFPGFPSPMLRFAPLPKPFPRMPRFPMPFFGYPMFPTFPPLPSVHDIANAQPGKGGTYSGIVISTKSEMKRDEDGKLVKTGGSTIVVNNDGDVKVEQTGDSPPPVLTNNPRPFFGFDAPKPKPPKLNRFKNFDFNFKSLDPENLKKIVPGENEYFKGKSVRSHSYSSNVNGVVKQEASVVKVENDNGKVNEENISFRKGGT